MGRLDVVVANRLVVCTVLWRMTPTRLVRRGVLHKPT